MKAKDIALKYNMLSVDEVALIQKCVKMLRPEMLLLEGVTTEQWESASKEQREKLSKQKGKIFSNPVLLKDDPLVIANIGANVGTSTCAILEANPNAFVFSIDVKPCPTEMESVMACGLPTQNVVRLLRNSNELANFPYQVDMVFVDGAHHDAAVQADIEVWMPKCKQIMMFHDYHHPRYADKPNVNLDAIVDEAMKDWQWIGAARYLVGFERVK